MIGVLTAILLCAYKSSISIEPVVDVLKKKTQDLNPSKKLIENTPPKDFDTKTPITQSYMREDFFSTL